MSPTARTLDAIRAAGGLAGVVERNLVLPSQAPIKRDLFGFIDIVAIRERKVVGIQATSRPNVAARVTKITAECSEAAVRWLEAGALIEAWGWQKYAKPLPGEQRLWRPLIYVVSLSGDALVATEAAA